MIVLLEIIGIAVVLGAVVWGVWYFRQKRATGQLDQIARKKAEASKLVSKAELAEGINRIPVVLSLTDDSIYYENPDLDAQLELSRIEEIEYADELATGRSIDGGRVLRLRSHGHAFEFVLDTKDARRWNDALPAHSFEGEHTRRAG
jgi:hypothetical protein